MEDFTKMKKVQILQKLAEHVSEPELKDLKRMRKDELIKVLEVHKKPKAEPKAEPKPASESAPKAAKKVSKKITEVKPESESKPKPESKPDVTRDASKSASESKPKQHAKTQVELDIVSLATLSKQLAAKRRRVNKLLNDAYIKGDVEGRVLELEKLKKEIVHLRHLKHNAAGRKEHEGLIERQEANKMQKKIDDVILGKKPSANIADKDDFIAEDVQNLIEAVPDNSNIMDTVLLNANKTNDNIPQ